MCATNAHTQTENTGWWTFANSFCSTIYVKVKNY